MADRVAVQARPAVAARLTAFVLERYPFAAAAASIAIAKLASTALDTARLRADLPGALRRALQAPPADLPDTTPSVPSATRWRGAVDELVEACDGFLRRAELQASLTREERREILRGMTLTRATDNRSKALFTGGEVRYKDTTFQGKGFRSLGQEAIYGAAIRLRRGEEYRTPEGWRGDVIAPIIRDLGAELAMSMPSPDGGGADRTGEMVRMVLSAQMGKAGPPMNGRDLHVGDFDRGILPAAAPLATGAMTLAGMALGFAQQGSGRVAITLTGEGATSLGEWHEAINLCAVRKLPIVFCIQNNQTALSTPVAEQSAVRVFADKAAGYGIPGITIDGTDPDEIAAAFAWAVERAREGKGPAIIELVAMRMCGHAHHDDMLYLGKDPQLTWEYPPLTDAGYANHALYEYWRERDPLVTYAARLEADGTVEAGEVARWREEAEAFVERQARDVIDAPWPDPGTVGDGVVAGEPARARVEVLDPSVRSAIVYDPPLPPLDPNAPHDAKGHTFLDAVMMGVGDALGADPRVFVIGEDVGGAYGNAFLLLRPLLKEFGSRILNSPIAEGAIIGACIGAALAGQRPIGEMQFNDFVATGFNQLVNNAAKVRYRWGAPVPMVLRMPWGGLRHAGPYHSQNTEGWFYRTPGLKIVVPSTPADARAAMAAAVADPDPVLYYEHIALYREPRIKQKLAAAAPAALPIGKAALRRAGGDLAIVSYGAYVHTALSVASRLAADGIEASVLDLRWLAPLDKDALLAVARHCSRVLIVHEDTRTGGIGESLAAIVQEEAFESLDAPVRIVGALDTPVPYSPPLEDAFLPSEAVIERAARLLVAY
jgi:pyruvate/2-oxoglutarate/acetoin dehydrogenase E1 component/TPP-dependent pyruvate/acetoin dehydrogenase alpha subunit